MRDQFSNNQQIRKPAVISDGGIVAAQSRKAAEVGVAVLAAGGDCVDAIIATTFALAVLEPWMSGFGGGGTMVLYRARDNRCEVIDYGMRAPNGLRVEDYPMSEGVGSDVFPWARVKDDRNLHGPGSIAVPGVVAGMAEAHRRHARLPWGDLLAPAVTFGRRGSRGRLVDQPDDHDRGRRPPTLPGQRRHFSGRAAAAAAMRHQVGDAAAARPPPGDTVAPGRARTAGFLPGRSGGEHRA
jgi:gamma-glutamyltranspeptidase